MKRKIFFVTIFSCISFLAFANVEMDINYYVQPVNRFDIKQKSAPLYQHEDSSVNNLSALGFEEKFTFYIGKPAFLDVGFMLANGFALFPDSSEFTYDFGYESFFKLGPAFRLNLSDFSGLYFAPGLSSYFMYGVLTDYTNTAVTMITFDIDTDIGYRLWLVNRDGFHFGLNMGVNLGVPFYGEYSSTTASLITAFFEALFQTEEENNISFSNEMKSGFKLKCYFGFCFNFGDRGYDRRKAAIEKDLSAEEN